MKWNDTIFNLYTRPGKLPVLPNGIEWLYPQQQPEVKRVVSAFLDKYYNDENERKLLLGINPGRFGAGVTGINFTAPKQLKENCGIEHDLKMQSELSAEFIYKVIDAMGGPEAFYSNYFLGSVSILGFVRNGKNINYYDDKALLETLQPFITGNIKKLLKLPVPRDTCYCIGEGKNLAILQKLNAQHDWFQQIVALPHPRFVMQYKRKEIDKYVQQYAAVLTGG